MCREPSVPIPRDAIEREVIGVWRRSRWLPSTCAQYLLVVRRFRRYCSDGHIDYVEHLTRCGVEEFAGHYVGPRLRRPAPKRVFGAAHQALFAWAHALRALGHRLPEWQPPAAPAALSPLLAEYVAYRQARCGVSPTTLRYELPAVDEFLEMLRVRGRRLGSIRTSDLDAFVTKLGRRLSRRTLRDVCSRLRAFLRFLHVTGRGGGDLASLLVAPRVRWMEAPRRALPWPDVQRILRSVRGDSPAGARDYAVLLLMTMYGFGAAEVASLRLDGIDWRGAVLRLRRPKTGAPIELPLLPAAARALIAYLRKGRPADSCLPEVFTAVHLPRRPISSTAVRHIVASHARRAGIRGHVGAHMLRHAHATRQVDAGVPLKIVGDILGHHNPASTSVYTRVAVRRLRAVALPVPR
jgi:integrase/recombinase XerD